MFVTVIKYVYLINNDLSGHHFRCGQTVKDACYYLNLIRMTSMYTFIYLSHAAIKLSRASISLKFNHFWQLLFEQLNFFLSNAITYRWRVYLQLSLAVSKLEFTFSYMYYAKTSFIAPYLHLMIICKSVPNFWDRAYLF